MSQPICIRHVLTARDTGARLQAQPVPAFGPPPPFKPSRNNAIQIAPSVAYQTIEGFGGAFTEAAATTLLKLPVAKQEEVLRAYFDRAEGHGYNLCRTHMNSCDFALSCYSYCEQPDDFELSSFSIDRDRKALLPMIQRAQHLAKGAIRLLASPWSPPAWMKTTGAMKGGGALRPECREAWARYYVRYIDEFRREGVPIWAISVQNEPAAVQRWDSCVYSAEEERDFVRDHLGPTLAASEYAGTKIVIWDHNRDDLYNRAKVVYDDPAAARYVWGTGFHWYVTDRFDNVQRHFDAWPDKKLLFTEGCQEGGPHFGEWTVGERYARSIIQDLNHGTVGWIDWNLLLDMQGGPNHVGNYCSAPILADIEKGEIHYQSSYPYLGHFSRFIRPGATRILTSTTRDELETLACRNPDGEIVVVVLNRSELQLPFSLRLGEHALSLLASPRSIQTLVLEP